MSAKNKIIAVLTMLPVISGCVILPEHISETEAQKFNTVESLLNTKIRNTHDITYGVYTNRSVTRPYVYASDYCAFNGGVFFQVKGFHRLPLVSYRHTEVFKRDFKDTQNKLARAFGDFECRRDNKILWGITISHNGVRSQFESIRGTDIFYKVKGPIEIELKKWEIEIKKKDIERKKLGEMIARQEELPFIRKIGAKICQITRYNNRRFMLIGFVEQVSELKIKIHIAQATLPNTPNIRAGGFTPHDIWDSPSNWRLCE